MFFVFQLQLSRADSSIGEEIRENIENMLCMPIKGRDGEVIAVLQAVNKMNSDRSNAALNEGFTQRDEKVNYFLYYFINFYPTIYRSPSFPKLLHVILSQR